MNDPLGDDSSSSKVGTIYPNLYGNMTTAQNESNFFKGETLLNYIYPCYLKMIKNIYDLSLKLQEEYNYLKKNIKTFSQYFKNLRVVYEIISVLGKTTESIYGVFDMFLFGNISKWMEIIFYIIYLFQLFVSIMNLISGIFLIFGFLSSFGKYLGHSGWCIASFNLVFLSILSKIILFKFLQFT